jgi:LPXTG-site transpeptidase (sortase) family protein
MYVRRNRRKTSSRWRSIAILMLFILGLGIFAYPIASNIIYKKASEKSILEFKANTEVKEDKMIKEQMDLAKAFNCWLAAAKGVKCTSYVFDEETQSSGLESYTNMLEDNELVGYITIPKINVNAPLYMGTSERVLQKGIGVMEGTSFPVGGGSTHTVLTGHRGLPTAELFTSIDKLEIGDMFYIKNIGETIAYKVDQIVVVEPTDFSRVALEQGKDYCTLLTCTPYMINSHRLLVRGSRTEYVEQTMEQQVEKGTERSKDRYITYGMGAAAGVIIAYLLFKLVTNRARRRQGGKRI